MRILIISAILPYPLDGGGKHGMYHMIGNLRKEMEVTLLPILKREQEADVKSLQELWPDVNIKPYYESLYLNKGLSEKIKKFVYSIFGLLKKKHQAPITDMVKFHSALFYSGPTGFEPECLHFVADVLKSKNFDFVQIEYYESLSLVHLIPETTKKIFIHHEIRFIRNEREMQLYKSVSDHERYLFQLYKTYELSTLNKYNAIITVSEVDKAVLQDLLPGKLVYASPSIISGSISTTPAAYQFNGKIVFVGGSGHFPNYDAVNWFLENVWEKVYSADNRLEFHIIGKWQEQQYSGYLSKYRSVFFDGFAEDLQIALSDSIMVVPIRIGSGMRMKILDAINCNIPFVTTSMGVEGLDFTDGRDCFIADGDDFATALLRLTENETLQQQFMENAKKTLISAYSEEHLYGKRRTFYKMLKKE